jgi:hypothetical protein
MAKTGLLNSILMSTYYIDLGRKGLASDGDTGEGRHALSTGLLAALAVFKAASDLLPGTADDLETVILVEHWAAVRDREGY